MLCRYLDANKFSGTVPAGISNLQQLSQLYVIVCTFVMLEQALVYITVCGSLTVVSRISHLHLQRSGLQQVFWNSPPQFFKAQKTHYTVRDRWKGRIHRMGLQRVVSASLGVA